MRKLIPKGNCQRCGQIDCPVWKDNYKVLDFGVPGIPPREPRMIGPTLCDDCESAWPMRRLCERCGLIQECCICCAVGAAAKAVGLLILACENKMAPRGIVPAGSVVVSRETLIEWRDLLRSLSGDQGVAPPKEGV